MRLPEAVLLAPAAVRDLRRIRAWIAADSGMQRAKDVVRTILDVVGWIAEMPTVGAPGPSVGDDVRCIVRRPYLIFYRNIDKHVQILRVINGRRDLHTAWLEDKPLP